MREAAVDALANIGGEATMLLFKQALTDEDESVRETAADILAELTAQRGRAQPPIPKLGKARNTRK